MVIDTHIHIYDPVYGKFEWPPEGSAFYRKFSVNMAYEEAEHAVSSFVVVGGTSEFELNARLLKETAEDAFAGAYIAQVNLADPGVVSYIQEYKKWEKYRGFRFFTEGSLSFGEKVTQCFVPGTVVELLGSWKELLQWYDFLEGHPQIPFVIEHLGRYFFDGSASG